MRPPFDAISTQQRRCDLTVNEVVDEKEGDTGGWMSSNLCPANFIVSTLSGCPSDTCGTERRRAGADDPSPWKVTNAFRAAGRPPRRGKISHIPGRCREVEDAVSALAESKFDMKERD